MSFRELHMIDVLELLRRWQAGQSAREIARAGAGDRKTVARYIAAARELEVGVTDALTEEVVRRVADRVQARPKASPSAAWASLEAERSRIETWLKGKDPLRLVRVHELLARQGVIVGYSTLRRFAHQELGFREPRSTVLLADCAPGEEAQIDFGMMGSVVVEGRQRRLWVLVVTLSYSRFTFVYPTFTQTVEDVCAGLDAAWAFFGGVPQRLVPDNPATMVIRADPKAPTLQRGFAEYAQVRGLFIDPARVARPQDKGRVENQVPYIRERWFAGETFSGDIGELRTHAAHWCREIAGARVHGTTRRVPREVFDLEELPVLQPVPTAAFDVPRWLEAKVHADHHIQVGRALYSAPTSLLHKTVDVRVDRRTVRIYFRNELIKVHPHVAPGKRSTDPTHYPVGKADYAMRSVDGVRAKAAGLDPHVAQFAERLLAGPLPWTKMRQAYGLLRLCERYGAPRVGAICERALSFDVLDVGRVERMLKSAVSDEQEATASGKLVALPARFARASEAFATVGSKDGGAS